jgi:hypothetical protein
MHVRSEMRYDVVGIYEQIMKAPDLAMTTRTKKIIKNQKLRTLAGYRTILRGNRRSTEENEVQSDAGSEFIETISIYQRHWSPLVKIKTKGT